MCKEELKIPKFGLWLIRTLSIQGEEFSLIGDFEEEYNDILFRRGKISAEYWYWKQIFISIIPRIINKIKWSIVMFKNYIKTSFRNIKRQKGFSFINIAGLAVGITCCILIMLWVNDELSYDKYHKNLENIYLVYTEIRTAEGIRDINDSSPFPLAKVLREECAEVKTSARISTHDNILVKYKDKSFVEDQAIAADPTVFDIFSFEFIKGDPKIAFSEPTNTVITESMSLKFFGQEEPMGKILNVNNMVDLKVTGVIKDIPKNSSFRFSAVIPFVLIHGASATNTDNWGGNPLMTFVLLHKNIDITDTEDKITAVLYKYDPPDSDPRGSTYKKILHLHPLKKLHLYNYTGGGLIVYLYVSFAIAIFVLIIACINFMNLTTARSSARAKEIAMRKTIGANKRNLIIQFFSESILMTVFAFIISIVLVVILLPVFNDISGKSLSINNLLNMNIILSIFVILIMTGFISGSYPALFLSSFKPVKVLKSVTIFGSKNPVLRRILVTIQFSISILLIICTLTISSQIKYMLNKDIGYDKDNLMHIPMTGELKNKYEMVKAELLKNSNIVNVTAGAQNPLYVGSTSYVNWEGKQTKETVITNWDFVDYDYIETFKMRIIKGRSFSKEYATDLEEACILNETAVKVMGLKDPIGKWIKPWFERKIIIGVVKDYHFLPYNEEIKPFILSLRPSWNSRFFVRIKSENISNTLGYIEDTLKKFNPDFDFDYIFLNDRIKVMYRSEEQLNTIFDYSAILAIVIACLGLLGLASYIAERRTKEIGIRKAMGASVPNIVRLLSKEFIILVTIANIIAWPIAYFVLRKWFQNYAYHTDISILLFFISGFSAIFFAIIAVSYQAVKAAIANPINSLRYE